MRPTAPQFSYRTPRALPHPHGVSLTCPGVGRPAAILLLPAPRQVAVWIPDRSCSFPVRGLAPAAPRGVPSLPLSFCPSPRVVAQAHGVLHSRQWTSQRPRPGDSEALCLFQELGLDRDVFQPGRLPQSCSKRKRRHCRPAGRSTLEPSAGQRPGSPGGPGCSPDQLEPLQGGQHRRAHRPAQVSSAGGGASTPSSICLATGV